MTKLAVIAGQGIHAALDWTAKHAAKNMQTIKEVSISKATITTDNTIYKIIQFKSDLNGSEYDGYLICPTYEDLVALVKERIKT